MNIYSKLQQARIILQQKILKKTGRNPFVGFQYFELSDFLPAINEILGNLKLASFLKINKTKNRASLIIINTEKTNEKIIFSIPFEIPELKNCNVIQNIGAGLTYTRRYLYMIAFEIVENDFIDAQNPYDGKGKIQNGFSQDEEKERGEMEDIFWELVANKYIPQDKRDAVKAMEERVKTKSYNLNNLKNAITFLERCEDLEKSKVIYK